MRSIRSLFVVAAFAIAFSASAQMPVKPAAEPATKEEAKKEESCDHGVKKAICTRCNPKLAAVYKAKGDWCKEHERAESQCVLCNPDLAKKGVK